MKRGMARSALCTQHRQADELINGGWDCLEELAKVVCNLDQYIAFDVHE